MRARLHARDGRLGFFREGTHELCDAGATGQLLPATVAWIARRRAQLLRARAPALGGVEIAENVPGRPARRHLELHDGRRCRRASRRSPTARAADRLTRSPASTSAAIAVRRRPAASPVQRLALRARRARVLPGQPLSARAAGRSTSSSLVPAGPGRRSLRGRRAVRAVAGRRGRATRDAGRRRSASAAPISSATPAPFARRVARRARAASKRSCAAAAAAAARPPTFIVDPPRTGLSKDALAGIIAPAPAAIVYVSCDVATLARDARALLDAGYELDGADRVRPVPEHGARRERVVRC